MDLDSIRHSDVVKGLLKSHFEFKKLFTEHETMEEKLRRFEGLKRLSAEEENERKQIQKMKLSGKDRMYEIIRDAEEGRTNE